MSRRSCLTGYAFAEFGRSFLACHFRSVNIAGIEELDLGPLLTLAIDGSQRAEMGGMHEHRLTLGEIAVLPTHYPRRLPAEGPDAIAGQNNSV
jgi:hypothetical protein